MRKSKNVKLNDGLESLTTKMGQKAAQRNYSGQKTTNNELLNAYNGSWTIRKYINKTIGDMLKKGRECYFDDFDEEAKKSFFDTHKKFKTESVITDVLFNVLLYGEAGVLAVTDTSENNYQTELNPSENLKRLYVFTRGEIKQEAAKNTFDESDIFEINNIKVHKSRFLLIKQGIEAHGKKKRESVSDVAVALDVAKMFDAITMSVSDLIEECKLDVYRMEGFNDQIAAGQEDKILRRLELISLGKSYTNAIAMDKNDEYESKETSLAGVADLWTKSSIVVAGALNRPISILFGEGAGGFSSGEEDNRSYYETIEELQNSYLRPLYEFIDSFILRALGKDTTLEFDFTSIDSINDVEKANILNTKSTAFSALIDKGVITEAMALKELRDDGLIKNITDEDIKEAELLSQEIDNDPAPII